MNKKVKVSLGVCATILCAGLLFSCNSFCTSVDVSHYLFAYDSLNNVYFNNDSATSDASEYIEYKFKNQSNYNSNISFGISRLQKYNVETTSYEDVGEISTILGTYGNLKYVTPGYYRLKNGSSEVDENSVNKDLDCIIGLNSLTSDLVTSYNSSGLYTPSFKYFELLDQKVLDEMLNHVNLYSSDIYKDHVNQNYATSITKDTLTYEDLYGYTFEEFKEVTFDNNQENIEDILGNNSNSEGRKSKENVEIPLGGRNYSLTTTLGYFKFYNEENASDYYFNLTKWNSEIANEISLDNTMSENFFTQYKTTLNSKVSSLKTCITINQGFYGHTSDDPLNETVSIEAKASDFWTDWGKAFQQHGFLEGLLVYPISTLVDNFAHAFGMNGWGQICAVLLVTLIVRLLFMAITLPSTISQQKQQFLQPELAKLQQKYPNSNTNDVEKQRLAQAQMALYKKYKVHPFLSLLTIIIQFPLFICVWNALSGAAALSSDAVLGLRLSDTIWNVLSNFSGWPGNGGWWTALVLILLMSAGQIFAMLIPQWLTKRRTKNIQKLTTNPAADKQSKTMKTVQWVMIIFTIILGFSLPSAMGVYWLAGAIFNIVQSLIMHLVFSKKGRLLK